MISGERRDSSGSSSGRNVCRWKNTRKSWAHKTYPLVINQNEWFCRNTLLRYVFTNFKWYHMIFCYFKSLQTPTTFSWQEDIYLNHRSDSIKSTDYIVRRWSTNTVFPGVCLSGSGSIPACTDSDDHLLVNIYPLDQLKCRGLRRLRRLLHRCRNIDTFPFVSVSHIHCRIMQRILLIIISISINLIIIHHKTAI